jgi:hypothetical protein
MACAHCVTSQRLRYPLLVKVAPRNRHHESVAMCASAAASTGARARGRLEQHCDSVDHPIHASPRGAVTRLAMCVK